MATVKILTSFLLIIAVAFMLSFLFGSPVMGAFPFVLCGPLLIAIGHSGLDLGPFAWVPGIVLAVAWSVVSARVPYAAARVGLAVAWPFASVAVAWVMALLVS